jgi:hypothetical protein
LDYSYCSRHLPSCFYSLNGGRAFTASTLGNFARRHFYSSSYFTIKKRPLSRERFFFSFTTRPHLQSFVMPPLLASELTSTGILRVFKKAYHHHVSNFIHCYFAAWMASYGSSFLVLALPGLTRAQCPFQIKQCSYNLTSILLLLRKIGPSPEAQPTDIVANSSEPR